ncbi:MAG: GIN domain-containing protein [Fimbriimonadaceae bacterium]
MLSSFGVLMVAACSSSAQTTSTRTIGSFTAISAFGIGDIEYVQAHAPKVVLEGTKELVERTETRVDGTTLLIQQKTTSNQSFRNARLKVTIYGPRVEKVTLQGAVKFRSSTLAGSAFKLDVSGASGATVSGKVARLTLHADGAVHVDAGKLDAETVSVNASGASQVQVTASRTVAISASGASNVTYGGAAKQIQTQLSGASKASRRN